MVGFLYDILIHILISRRKYFCQSECSATLDVIFCSYRCQCSFYWGLYGDGRCRSGALRHDKVSLLDIQLFW